MQTNNENTKHVWKRNHVGESNPNWKGGMIDKVCEICKKEYKVINAHASSKYCSLQCVGISQRKTKIKKVLTIRSKKLTPKTCEVCSFVILVPTSQVGAWHCCSKKCSYIRRSALVKGKSNPNWNSGACRLPYTWNFKEISKSIIKRDGFKCMNPGCLEKDNRLSTHHIDHDKQNNDELNLICLCISCNSRANFNREHWKKYYSDIVNQLYVNPKTRREGVGWHIEEY